MQTKSVQNKSANRWLDVQVVIATLAMTFVLALWNMFAGSDRISNNNANLRSQTTTASSSVSSSPSASGTRILLGGSAPSTAPRPLTVTSSSRP